MKLNNYIEFIDEGEVNEFISGTLLDVNKGPGDAWQLPISKRWAAIGPLGWRQAYKANKHGKKNAEMWAKTGTDKFGDNEEQFIKDDQVAYESRLIESRLTAGDCYPAGGRLIMEFFGDKEHKLVHGMVNGQGSLEGVRYGHCWVESRDTVLDHSNGRKLEIPTQVYYALGRIDPKECKYYTPKEAAKMMSTKKHWGPWEMSGDPVMSEDIPDTEKEIGDLKQRISRSELKKIKEA